MSAIGDYIHYRTFLYKAYGTKYPSKGATRTYDYGNPSAVFAAQQDRIRQQLRSQAAGSISEAEKLSLKENIAYILSSAEDDSYLASVQQAITEKLQEDFNSGFTINWDSGNVETTPQQISDAKQTTKNVIDYDQKNKTIRLKTIQDRINYINNAINSDVVGETTREKLQASLGEIQAQLDAIKKEGEDAIPTSGETKNLVSTINKAVRKINSNIDTKNAKGRLFEYVVAAARGMTQQMAQDQIKDTITKYVVGQKTNRIGTNKTAFADFVDLGLADSSIEIPLDFNKPQGKKMQVETSLKETSSSGKIDVLFDLGDLKDTGGISVKNVQLQRFNINLVSNSPMYNLIENQNTDFINHYFNLVAEHPDSNYLDWMNILYAHETMRMTLLYQAFTGDVYHAEGSNNPGLASLFVVNNNTVTGPSSIHIYSIGDLVEEAMDAIGSYVEITANNMNLEDVKMINNFYSSGYPTRISTLISYTHGLKIRVSISPNLLSNTTGWS